MMLGLPGSTEVRQQIPKKSVYEKFNLSAAERNRFDADIHKMFIVNEISSKTLNIAVGEKVKRIYAIEVALQSEKYNPKSIVALNDLINQKLVFILTYGEQSKLAIYNGKLIEGQWVKSEGLILELKGLDMDSVWDNIVIDVGDIIVEEGRTLDEQIAEDSSREEIQKQIDILDRKIKNEKQPRIKRELYNQIRALQESQRNGL